jgi:hypothetical protein
LKKAALRSLKTDGPQRAPVLGPFVCRLLGNPVLINPQTGTVSKNPKLVEAHLRFPLSGQLVAMLKAWKLKSQFSNSDDLIFPNREGHHLGHDNMIREGPLI